MTKFLSIFLMAGVASFAAPAIAQSTAAATQKGANKIPAKKKAPKIPTYAEAPPETDEDVSEAETTGSTVSEFHCELGNKVTIYRNAEDGKHIALRWLKRIHRLRRVSTSTGADRFENRKAGLIWIGIPAKSILLDSKKGQQLANECRTAGQVVPAAPAAPDLLAPPPAVVKS